MRLGLKTNDNTEVFKTGCYCRKLCIKLEHKKSIQVLFNLLFDELHLAVHRLDVVLDLLSKNCRLPFHCVDGLLHFVDRLLEVVDLPDDVVHLAEQARAPTVRVDVAPLALGFDDLSQFLKCVKTTNMASKSIE